ncbi:MAG: hypothetical protein JNK85_23760 [Verrucomicrobiales bacterium]|nr:hypothetical protein [Verrucomicrobiales bacterium]
MNFLRPIGPGNPGFVAFVMLVSVCQTGYPASKPPKEPRFEQRRLSSWLLAMPDWFECTPTNCQPFLALGSNAVPYLAWVVTRTNVEMGDVLSVLRMLHAERTIEPSAEMLRSVQAKAAFVLEQLGPVARPAAPALLVALRQGSGDQKLGAALALASILPRNARAMGLLEAVLDSSPITTIPHDRPRDPDSAVAQALAELTTQPRSGPWERAVATVALCQLSEDPSDAVKLLIHRWANQDSAFRMNILPLLTSRLRDQALPVIQRAQGDPDPRVRRNAVVLISSLHGPHPVEVTESLVRGTKDTNADVRRVTLETLWRIQPNSDTALDAALRGVTDEDASVRSTAAAKLSRYSGPRAMEIPPAYRRR